MRGRKGPARKVVISRTLLNTGLMLKIWRHARIDAAPVEGGLNLVVAAPDGHRGEGADALRLVPHLLVHLPRISSHSWGSAAYVT